MSILIVDDEQATSLLIKEMLDAEGYADVHFANSGEEALEFLGIGRTPGMFQDMDLILLDIMLGGLDGKEVGRRIKAEPFYRHVPIIMVTGKDEVRELQDSFSMGAVDYVTKPVNSVELLARIQAHLRIKSELDHRHDVEQKLQQQTRQLESKNRELSELSYVDGLTGVKNRRFFDEIFEKEWRRALRQNEPISLLMVDIDYFKLYNDTYGHQQGDESLVRVAAILADSVRRPTDFVSRYGGEEFAVVLPNTDTAGALVVAEHIRHGVADGAIGHQTSEIGDLLTVSIGLASIYPRNSDTPEQLLSTADRALYRAKKEGRDRIISN